MGLFSRRRALNEPNVAADWKKAEWLTWEAPANVVREGHYQETIEEMCGPVCAEGYLVPVEVTLRRQPHNEYDTNAIAVFVGPWHVGHIAREVAAQVAPAVDRVACSEWKVCGIIRGGTTRKRHFGVHLWMGRLVSAGPDVYFRTENFDARAWPPSKDRIEAAISTLREPGAP